MPKIKTVQQAFEQIAIADERFVSVMEQIQNSPWAMGAIEEFASKAIRNGAVRESDLLASVSSAMSLGVKIGLEMGGAYEAAVAGSGRVIQ